MSIASTDQTNTKCVIAGVAVAVILIAVLMFGIKGSDSTTVESEPAQASKAPITEVEPTETKVEPTEAKVEPTETKVEPTEVKVEPSDDAKVEPVVVTRPVVRQVKRRANVRELAELLEWTSGLRMSPTMRPAARTDFNYVYYYRPEKRFLDFQDYCYLYSFSSKTVVGVSALYRGKTPEATHRVHEDTVAYLERLTGGKMRTVTSLGRTIRRLTVPNNPNMQYQLEEVLPAGRQSYVELKLIDLELRRRGAEEVRLLATDPDLKAAVNAVPYVSSEFARFFGRR